MHDPQFFYVRLFHLRQLKIFTHSFDLDWRNLIEYLFVVSYPRRSDFGM